VRKNVKDKVKGAAVFFHQESTNTNNETTTETKSSVESSDSVVSTPNIESSGNVESEVSISVSTNVSGIPKKAKYLETRVQRSYYLDKELVKELDKFAKKNDYDKSDIINHILSKFLQENGKI
jgi:hypothetical protein